MATVSKSALENFNQSKKRVCGGYAPNVHGLPMLFTIPTCLLHKPANRLYRPFGNLREVGHVLRGEAVGDRILPSRVVLIAPQGHVRVDDGLSNLIGQERIRLGQ